MNIIKFLSAAIAYMGRFSTPLRGVACEICVEVVV